MSIWLRIVRWGLAMPAAALGFIVGFVMVTAIWQPTGGNAGLAYVWAVALGTILGGVLGALIAPPDQRKLASRLVVGAVIAVAAVGLVIGSITHTLRMTIAYDIEGSLLGGLIVVRGFNRRVPYQS